MKIFLTGATGFVGNHLVNDLLANKHEVYAFVRNLEKAKPLEDKGVYLVHGDLKTKTIDLKSIKDIDVVIHLAGLLYSHDNNEFYQVNTEASAWLGEIFKKLPIKKFIFISSIAARGPNTDGSTFESEGAVSHYGKSKFNAEQKLKTIFKDNRLVIVRPPIVYGPGDTATLTLFKMFKKGMFPIMGEVPQKVSFVFVKDLAKSLLHIAEQDQTSKEALYPEDGNKGYNWIETTELAQKVFNRTIYTPTLPMGFAKTLAYGGYFLGKLFGFVPSLTKDKYLEMKHPYWFCSSESLHKGFNIPKFTPLEEGLKITKEWYEERKWL